MVGAPPMNAEAVIDAIDYLDTSEQDPAKRHREDRETMTTERDRIDALADGLRNAADGVRVE